MNSLSLTLYVIIIMCRWLWSCCSGRPTVLNVMNRALVCQAAAAADDEFDKCIAKLLSLVIDIPPATRIKISPPHAHHRRIGRRAKGCALRWDNPHSGPNAMVCILHIRCSISRHCRKHSRTNEFGSDCVRRIHTMLWMLARWAWWTVWLHVYFLWISTSFRIDFTFLIANLLMGRKTFS